MGILLIYLMIRKAQGAVGFKSSLNEIVRVLSSITNEKLVNFRSILLDYSQIILIGNGGSNAIASHIAVDYNKFLNKKTLAFTDSSMLTAYFNDFGFEKVYTEYIKQFYTKNTLIILISSSGNSANIFEAVKYCNKNKINFCLLTGFSKDNRSKILAEKSKYCIFNFWVDSKSYGVVENCHQIFLHSAVVN